MTVGHPYIREEDRYSSPEVIGPRSALLGCHRKVGGEFWSTARLLLKEMLDLCVVTVHCSYAVRADWMGQDSSVWASPSGCSLLGVCFLPHTRVQIQKEVLGHVQWTVILGPRFLNTGNSRQHLLGPTNWCPLRPLAEEGSPVLSDSFPTR